MDAHGDGEVLVGCMLRNGIEKGELPQYEISSVCCISLDDGDVSDDRNGTGSGGNYTG